MAAAALRVFDSGLLLVPRLLDYGPRTRGSGMRMLRLRGVAHNLRRKLINYRDGREGQKKKAAKMTFGCCTVLFCSVLAAAAVFGPSKVKLFAAVAKGAFWAWP